MKSASITVGRGVPMRWGWRLRLELAGWRHGAWPVMVLSMLVLAAWLNAVERPALREANRLAQSPPVLLGADLQHRGDVHRWAVFRAALPSQTDQSLLMQALVRRTKHELAWRQAEFQHTEDRALGLLRTQVTVPVAGAYPDLRQALDAALRDFPNLSIDQIQIQRPGSADTTVSARVRLSWWMALSPATVVPPKPGSKPDSPLDGWRLVVSAPSSPRGTSR